MAHNRRIEPSFRNPPTTPTIIAAEAPIKDARHEMALLNDKALLWQLRGGPKRRNDTHNAIIENPDA